MQHGFASTKYQPNRRKAARRRTRMRSGKVCTAQGAFLADCLIFDRSRLGVRIRLAGRRPLPGKVQFFDDELRLLHVARVVWQQGNEAGLAFVHEIDDERYLNRARTALAGKYYALWRGGRP